LVHLYRGGGVWEGASAGKQPNPRAVPFLSRPVVCQVSRWDALKGWLGLVAGFASLKAGGGRRVGAAPAAGAGPAGGGPAPAPPAAPPPPSEREEALVCNAVLLLVGPDPRGIADDPEGSSHLAAVCAAVDALPHHVRADVRVVLLPMDELGANALMVNAIQRASYVVVQNSLKEGHGLTVMEALYKRQVVVGTRQALGIRSQLVQGETGILVEGDPSDGENVAAALLTALTQDGLRRSLAHNAQRYAVESGLSFTVRRTRKGGAAPLRAPLLPPFALSHKRTH